MSFEKEVLSESNYIRINVLGEFSVPNIFELVGFVKESCVKLSADSVLVDCSNVSGSLSEADRFAGGKHVAEVLGPDIRSALVLPIGQVTKLGEMTAVNRGAQLFVTDSETEAIDWLNVQ